MQNSFKGISKFHWISGLLLTVIFISWVTYQQWIIKHPPQVTRLAFDSKCDLRAGPCVSLLQDGSSVSFAIEPRSIPISDQLTLEVIVSGMTVDKVTVDINGVDMKMPPNIINLKDIGNAHYSAKGALTFCTRSIMEWESVVQLDTGDKQIKVPYRFITSKETY